MPKKWSREEELFLFKNYEKMPKEELLKKFGVTRKSLSHKIKRLRDKNERQQLFPFLEKKGESKAKQTELAPSGFEIMTEEGWKPVMFRKKRIEAE
ncbi:hypothetical protein ISS37_07605 [candidate division KSB1 bacterium]|nr:hypothetical protein [candidate division KSB1 bacterium]